MNNQYGGNVIQGNFPQAERKMFAMAMGQKVVPDHIYPELYVQVYLLPATCIPDTMIVLTDDQALFLYDKNPAWFSTDEFAWRKIIALAENRKARP